MTTIALQLNLHLSMNKCQPPSKMQVIVALGCNYDYM